MQIDDNGFASAGEILFAAVHANDDAQRHTGTSSGFPKMGRGRVAHFFGSYPATFGSKLATPMSHLARRDATAELDFEVNFKRLDQRA